MQKFENVDILKSLKAIMQTHTEHFQSDFDIDIKILPPASKSLCTARRCSSPGDWETPVPPSGCSTGRKSLL